MKNVARGDATRLKSMNELRYFTRFKSQAQHTLGLMTNPLHHNNDILGTNEGVAAATAHVNAYFRSVTNLIRNVTMVLTAAQREKLTSSDLTRYVFHMHCSIQLSWVINSIVD